MIYLIAAISILLNLTMVWVIRNLYVKNAQLEEIVESINLIETNAIKYHRVLLGILTNAYTEFKRIDHRGAFSSDDEVGWSFRLLKDLIQDLTEKLKQLELDENDEREPN